MRLRRTPSIAGPIARKAKPDARPARAVDRSLERQAEEATQQALRGNVNVSRVLTPAPAGKVELPASTGRTLPTGVRRQAERAFGADFSAVRIHTDAAAAAAAAREDARAFTAGRCIYFAEGAYAPGTDAGRALLFHELAHVLQQTGRRESPSDIRATDRSGTGPPQVRGGKRDG